METALRATAARLLGVPDPRFSALPGGGNNRSFRVDWEGGTALLKHYFRHPGDPRDRLDAEFRFCAYAWDCGLRAVARPLDRDDAQGLGLYGFLPGRRVEAGEVDAEALAQALAFLRGLQAGRERATARALPPASEACFSEAEHVRMLEGRLARLERAEAPEVRGFLAAELRPAWEALRRELGPPSEAPLPPEARVLSPSDFGFHNALRTEDGRYAFLDFEYAGWDDPAKLVCDFFGQVAVPAPSEAFPAFARAVAELTPDAEGTLARIDRLRPLYRLKWCCILLNAFLPVDQARRAFARPGDPGAPTHQLAQARALLLEP